VLTDLLGQQHTTITSEKRYARNCGRAKEKDQRNRYTKCRSGRKYASAYRSQPSGNIHAATQEMSNPGRRKVAQTTHTEHESE
jgi:hypothetical protein